MFELNEICNTIEQDNALLGSVCGNIQTFGLSYYYYLLYFTFILYSLHWIDKYISLYSLILISYYPIKYKYNDKY